VIQIERQYTILVTPADSPAHTVAELVALARNKRGGLKFASSGNATPSHLGLSLFSREAGINLCMSPTRARYLRSPRFSPEMST
jgi:tripartite-type tricarboxylate transporter receptor subunit TctC